MPERSGRRTSIARTDSPCVAPAKAISYVPGRQNPRTGVGISGAVSVRISDGDLPWRGISPHGWLLSGRGSREECKRCGRRTASRRPVEFSEEAETIHRWLRQATADWAPVILRTIIRPYAMARDVFALTDRQASDVRRLSPTGSASLRDLPFPRQTPGRRRHPPRRRPCSPPARAILQRARPRGRPRSPRPIGSQPAGMPGEPGSMSLAASAARSHLSLSSKSSILAVCSRPVM